MWIAYYSFFKLDSRYKNQTLLHGPSVSRTTQSTSKEDTLTSISNEVLIIERGFGIAFQSNTNQKICS